MRTHFVIIVLVLVLCSNLSAQHTFLSLNGRLFDAATEEPLLFAAVYLKGTSIGTTSNGEGSFLFHVPIAYKDSTVTISMIGYTSMELPVDDFGDSKNIYLTEQVLPLNEVVVNTDKTLTAKQIVKKAYQSIPNNYPSEPYILKGFIRDLQVEDSSYVELIECAANLYYLENAAQREPSVELVELRQSYIANKHPWNEQWDRKNSIVDLVEDDFVRFDYGPIRGGKGWKFTCESVVPFDGKLVYKVIATKQPFSTAQLFIDIESFAFVRIEYARAANDGKFYKRRLTNGQQEVAYHLLFEYQEYKGKWYLKYQKEEDTWNIYEGLESDQLLFVKSPKKELFINQIITEAVEQYPFSSNLNRNQSIESQATPYNSEFWRYYNAPLQTKELSKIEAYLKDAQLDLEKER